MPLVQYYLESLHLGSLVSPKQSPCLICVFDLVQDVDNVTSSIVDWEEMHECAQILLRHVVCVM